MPDWDENSDQLWSNLDRLIKRIESSARCRGPLTLKEIKVWHIILMEGLETDDPAYVGAFRGESGVNVNVEIGQNVGMDARKVAASVRKFEHALKEKIARFDEEISPGKGPDSETLLREVVALCAWAHAEWVRIHPFVNGNGRTARLIANCLAMRYGLPPFVQLRPRPDLGYGHAGAEAMR